VFIRPDHVVLFDSGGALDDLLTPGADEDPPGGSTGPGAESDVYDYFVGGRHGVNKAKMHRRPSTKDSRSLTPRNKLTHQGQHWSGGGV